MKILTGSQSVKIDSAGRLALPAVYRDALLEQCEGSVFITLSPHLSCAMLMSDSFWKNYEANLRKQRGEVNMNAWMRRLYSNLSEVAVNTDARLVLPLPRMLSTVIGVEKGQQAVVSGSGAEYLEVWSERHWLDYMQSATADDTAAVNLGVGL